MTLPPPPPTPAVVIHLGNEAITLTGPSNAGKAGMDVGLWAHEETLYSPRGDSAAVRFCWDAVKYHGCRVYLARPGGAVSELKNSDVIYLLWTQDGEYLAGAGANTLRLWNLSGGMRSVVYRTKAGAPGNIERLWLEPNGRGRGDLCVSSTDAVRSDQPGQLRPTLTLSAARYSLPALTRLGLNTVQALDGEAACPAGVRPAPLPAAPTPAAPAH
ncbi:hypothetical protein [Deinococcus sp. Marseille-Q6407]|uniref:hypothetical protein n=1 Tax=Deinococcus sp. Marseille-Q6407 TaxID=2969223 RepID=UPI0021BE5988|nr:hypothetical protein [Deinococcus sp. Marseille-Q6407]